MGKKREIIRDWEEKRKESKDILELNIWCFSLKIPVEHGPPPPPLQPTILK